MMAETEVKSSDFEENSGSKQVSISTVEMTEERDQSPPTYNGKTTGAPPSYASIFGQLKDAKEESSGNADFAKKAVAIVTCGGLCNIITIFIFWVLTVICIAVGAAYNHMCPASPMIPKYLIVFGTFYTLKVLIAILRYFRYRCESDPEDKEPPAYIKAIDGLIDCFLLIWFIVGNVYVYGLNGKYQWTDPSADQFCNRSLYLFAFWVITIQYIMVLLACCVCCGCLVILCFCGLKNKDSFSA